MRTKKAYKYCS